MKKEAIGVIETIGFTAAVEAIDVMTKASNVRLVGSISVGSGLISVVVRGDIGAVKSAIDASIVVVKGLGRFETSLVIPRPHDEAVSLLPV